MERLLIKMLEQGIQSSFDDENNNDTGDEVSWSYEQGVLLSRNEAIQILDILKQRAIDEAVLQAKNKNITIL